MNTSTEPRIDPLAQAQSLAPLREFIATTTRIVEQDQPEHERVEAVRVALAKLISSDTWLPESAAVPHPDYYQQHLLHCDPLERFSVVSFVWGPGQRTPVHDHMVWGLIGMLRGSETGQSFKRDAAGALIVDGPAATLAPGDIEMVSPRTGDIHQVSNVYDDRVSISIHVYGGNIGAVARHVFDPQTGAAKSFVSGYSSPQTPNLWDLSHIVRDRLQREAA
ncbi:cysteine dioxygenase [Ottowia thiooxydans]|uniref:cysteine dioxygenase family protein n=1 Tax=Ottowia thiooxydans TaxID=219182 RepID=UPI00040255F1|nr:cysteine dioxygenase [Ottowia thiooxydans]